MKTFVPLPKLLAMTMLEVPLVNVVVIQLVFSFWNIYFRTSLSDLSMCCRVCTMWHGFSRARQTHTEFWKCTHTCTLHYYNKQFRYQLRCHGSLLYNATLTTLLLNTNCSKGPCCWVKRLVCPVWCGSIVHPSEAHLLYSCWTWARRVKWWGRARAGVDANRIFDEDEK